MTAAAEQAPLGPELTIRTARPADAAAVQAIYAPYVEATAVTFECATPSVAEVERRIQDTLERYPYLVAEQDGRVVGFTCAGPLRRRAAYDWSVETTIYVEAELRGGGVGRALYGALEEALGAMGVKGLYACVAFADGPDEHLTDASLRFHERLGFAKVGEFRDCGSKFDRWYSVAWMGKRLGELETPPVPIRPFAG